MNGRGYVIMTFVVEDNTAKNQTGFAPEFFHCCRCRMIYLEEVTWTRDAYYLIRSGGTTYPPLSRLCATTEVIQVFTVANQIILLPQLLQIIAHVS